ncbi:tetratricopeptide repeat protein 16 isoform 4-T6 [Morphnus guianensis]
MAIEHNPQKPLYYLCRASAHLCLRRVESAREDAALSQHLRLNPADGKILSLISYLFPRKTVCAVLRSKTGCLAQESLEKTAQSPPELTILADVAWCDCSNRCPVVTLPRS